MTLHNFNAGPSILPKTVLSEASNALLDFNGSGLSILEIGHRTPLFTSVMEEARALVRELLQLDQAHEVLFLHGGATLQFVQVPMNLLGANQVANYTETGTWSEKAIKEARLFGGVQVAGSSLHTGHTTIPKSLNLNPSGAYLHLTTNETIAGTQWHQFPTAIGMPLVADMSSDIMSRVLDFNQFDLIYAGAQKNMGPAGVSLVIVNKNCLGKIDRSIPAFMDYRLHIKEASMLNTPPVFAVYVVLLTLRWLKAQGGVAVMEQKNKAKAKLFYDTLDALPLFQGPVTKEDRSMMNAVFLLQDPKLEKEFLIAAEQEGMVGIKGHRSVGGFRVSLYNALPIESVQAITSFMHSFSTKKG
ncbi:MAG: 3-phosphoserine/phosphohydroxythreonine transaminase [Bacteroidetes bacterium]|nr:3-phosphoserine/phosphohydroxythreonine transaminase [Bacteroidota bacterium]